MEMKQKEQEINKRKKRLLWKEKRMKETVLNAMNPVEREIFEKELQKVHLKKSTALNDIGKTVWDTKKIRELLDQDAELEEIKRFFDENQLKPDQYNRNAIPLAAYTYWYGRGCGREDVCLWALESATTIDGLLQVQESSHLEKIAKKFISMDKYGVVAFRKMYLHEELCWTDAPNYLAAVMSGNVSLLQMFEAKDEEMTEENMEYWNTPVNGIVFREPEKPITAFAGKRLSEIFISRVFSQRRFCPAVRRCWITASTIMISMAQAWRTEKKRHWVRQLPVRGKS